MDVLFAAFEMIARADVLIALSIGAIGGVLIGAIPGVGPAVAIAILLPATFSFEPIVGLTLLLGIYGSSLFGGAIPAILINTPGTAVNALTTYDGYPMAKRGEARRALSLAYSASFFGAVFSIMCLLAISPVLSYIAPLFGSRDIFMAALLGVVCVVLAHRNRTLVAASLLCLGMFINVIGMESARYSKRFTFDQTWLNSGIDLIVVLLGLFALSQAYMLLGDKSKQATPPSMEGGSLSGFKELFQHKRIASVSSAFGVIMGMIPGVGEFTAQFFSYSYAQGTSKNPNLIGKGSPEGLIASEAANNAVPAAAMIPLLALGIPGESLTAMMLSVFYVHGVVPGPKLFETQPEFLLSLFLVLLIINVVVLTFLTLTTKTLVQIIRIPNRIIGVVVLTLSLIGVYSLRNSLVDCAIAAAFGLFGFILKRLDWPIVPIILGMVLGRIMEDKFRASMARVETPIDFINRPVSGVMFGLIMFPLSLHFFTLYRQSRKG
ncbi:MAG: tripartite tricarboxylate transporter permease [Rhodospirillales bacterium]|nr:tripartite tricarboxylate transporter permease [Rhodospirillales bacterium]